MKKKITIIGSGALGTALANILADADKNNDVLIYGVDEAELKDLEKGKNTKYFNDIEVNKFKTTNDIKKAVEKTDYIVLALPSKVIDSIMNSIIENLKSKALIINGCKGFYPGTEKPLHGGLVDKSKECKNIRGVITIAGPSFAIEMVKKALTSIAAVGYDEKQVKEVQKLFNTEYFKLYRQTDVVGAEIGGIYKNILAIGAGMLAQLGYKINTLASYLTRGMKELATLNKHLGGKDQTIYGLTGLGDLILTATDKNSRNYTFGMNFVKGDKDTKNVTLEGLTALEIVNKIRIRHKLYLPIQEAIYNVIHNGAAFDEEIKKLWSSKSKSED